MRFPKGFRSATRGEPEFTPSSIGWGEHESNETHAICLVFKDIVFARGLGAWK